MPQISVIVPVYNVEPYIHRCVDSILAQTFTDFELILVDDGSPDNCPAICDEYARKDNRIKVIHQINGGLSAARNTGLNHVSGEYVLFVDSDDSINNLLLEKVVPYMERGCDLVAFSYVRINDSDVQKEHVFQREEWLLNQNNRVEFYIKTLLQYKIGWEAWLRIFRRSIIEKHNIRFEDNAKIFAEDLYFSLCYCAHANKIVCLDNAMYYYYQREDSIMGQEKVVLNAGRMNELGKTLLEYFKNESVDASLIQAFPVIYYFIMENVIARYCYKNNNLSYERFRKLLKEDILDFDFYSTQMNRLRWNRKWLRKMYSPYETETRINIAEYYSNGNKFLFKVKNKLNIYAEWMRVNVIRRMSCRK